GAQRALPELRRRARRAPAAAHGEARQVSAVEGARVQARGLRKMSAARGGAILAAAIGIHAPIPSFADISIPTIIVGRFEKDGKPYNEPVQFTAHCFGWAAYPGDPGFPPGKK